MKPTTVFQTLVDRAESEVEAIGTDEVKKCIGNDGVLLVDLRDVRELKREGKIPGSVHVPRGMLEFWIDPDCPYYKFFFDDAKEIIFYCNKGWRSALSTKTVQDMGLNNVRHMRGGFDQWVKDGGEVDTC